MTRSAYEELFGDIVTKISGLYCMLLICCYIGFAFTEMVTFPQHYQYFEAHGLLLYVVGLAIFFLTPPLFHGMRKAMRKDEADVNDFVIYHAKSHVSFAIRCGAVIFGIFTTLYYMMELWWNAESRKQKTELAENLHISCSSVVLVVDDALLIIFTTFQILVIVLFPRIIFNFNSIFDSFGTMHLVATNLIIWLRTIIKESVHEVLENQELLHQKVESGEISWKHGNQSHTPMSENDASSEINLHTKCLSIIHNFERIRDLEYACHDRHSVLNETFNASYPFLFPPVIEFSLIGALMSFVMWSRIKRRRQVDSSDFKLSKVKWPNATDFLKKCNVTKSQKGYFFGCLIFALAVLNLCIFYGLNDYHLSEEDTEYTVKSLSSVVNIGGIVGLALGFHRFAISFQNINESNTDESEKRDNHHGIPSSLDTYLLYFTSFFVFLYLTITVLTGFFNTSPSRSVGIMSGIIEIVQIAMQIVFLTRLHDMEEKAKLEDFQACRPEVLFISIFNFSQWLVTTFEIQKMRASVVEAEFYGFLPWLFIQRTTLPLFVFFRFHSFVMSIDLWKSMYAT